MLNRELLQPSLANGEIRVTKSYDIDRFFYLGFFGGVLPVMILGTRNAIWLRCSKKMIAMLLGISLLLCGLKLAYVAWTGADSVALLSRIMGVALAVVYRYAQRKRYKLHSVIIGEDQPVFWWGLLAVVAGIVFDSWLVTMGKGIHDVFDQG